MDGSTISKKPDPVLVEELRTIMASIPDATPRMMFGCDCFFVHGHCAGGIWRDAAIFKLAADDAAAFLKLPGTTPFSPGPKMTMSGWYVLPHALASNPATLRTWTERAAVFAASLPAKVPKAKRPAATKKAVPTKAAATKKAAPSKKAAKPKTNG